MILKTNIVLAFFFVFLSSCKCELNDGDFKDYNYVESTNSLYKLHKPAAWEDVKKTCESEDAVLFYPEDAEEAKVPYTLQSKQNSGRDFYIGVSDIKTEGDFETVDGDSIAAVYDNWGEGEPNDDNDGEDCVILRADLTLNDIDCKVKQAFVCKKVLESDLQWNAQCNMPDIDYTYDTKMQRCYKFHLNAKNWTDAQATCEAEHSYLAEINSRREAQVLVKLAAEAPIEGLGGNYLKGSIHLGFHNRDGEGWRTTRGKKLEATGYAVWGNLQPDGGEEETCGAMFSNGLLNDISCQTRSFFICEHEVKKDKRFKPAVKSCN